MFHSNFKLIYLVIIVLIGLAGYYWLWPMVRGYNARGNSADLYNQMREDAVPWEVLHRSPNGNPIYIWQTGGGDDVTLIFGGFHGNEFGGFDLVLRLARYIHENPDVVKSKVVIVPVLNPDGLLAGTRTNSNEVDVNRNFPTENWSPAYESKRNYPGQEPASEVETLLAMKLVEDHQPDKIISVHAPLEVVNYDGPAGDLARAMARHNGYPTSGDIGYATPGSFGTWAGKELNIPTITLELPPYDPDEAWEENRDALITAINY